LAEFREVFGFGGIRFTSASLPRPSCGSIHFTEKRRTLIHLNDQTNNRRFCMLPPSVARFLPRMERSDTAVLIVLCGARDWQTDEVSMGQRLIAQQAGLSDERIVADAIARLHAFGLLQTIKAASRGRGGRAVWRVVFDDDAAEECRNDSGNNDPEIPDSVRVLETRNHSGINDQKPEPVRHSTPEIPEQIPEPVRHVLETRNTNSLSPACEGEPQAETCDGLEVGGMRQPPGARQPQQVGRPPIDDATAAAAIAAFDRWAEKPPTIGRGFATRPGNNEHAPIIAMLCTLADASPIPRPSGPIPRVQLVPQAIDALIGRGMAFKTPAFAAGCVRTLLADWAAGASSPDQSVNGQRDSDAAKKKWLKDASPGLPQVFKLLEGSTR